MVKYGVLNSTDVLKFCVGLGKNISLFVYISILVFMKSPAQVAMFYKLGAGESPNLFFKVPKSLVLIFRDISCLATELTAMN